MGRKKTFGPEKKWLWREKFASTHLIGMYLEPVLNYKILNPLGLRKDATLTEPNADATVNPYLSHRPIFG